MVSTTSNSDSNHELKQTQNSKTPKNAYQIGGLQVEFPYQPYGTQLAFMSRVISTLDRAQRDGHCHALLESPTGTGKSLSLLCSVLAWQQSYKSRFPNGKLSCSPQVATDPSNPQNQPSDAPLPNNVDPQIPTIFYASRTHAQITQVIREYKKTSYRVYMTVLGARKRYCTNPRVQGKDNVDDICRVLIKDKRNPKCPEFKRTDRILCHSSLRQKGHNGVHDIEDLVKIGTEVQGCPYFASWKMLEVAKLVFCPYSYIIDPVVRGRINLEGAIIIFDEAHNMEDIAREAGSIELEEETLLKLRKELEVMNEELPEIYDSLFEMVEGMVSWINSKKNSLSKRDSHHYFSSWSGERALRELQEFNITQDYFPFLEACFNTAMTKAEAETEPDMPSLSGLAVSTLEELFAAFKYFFSRNGSHILDYELGLQRRSTRNRSDTWTHTFSLWCMNPSVVFKDLAERSLSIILTSGTLSPMNSFSSELGVQFGTCLEAPHVIDANLQVWAGSVSNGPNNFPLNASYKTADEVAFQDDLGKSLEEIFTIVPGGSLVFFPSYKLMEKLSARWRETGQWTRLCSKKDIFLEPRGPTQDEFPTVLKEFYDSVSGKNRLLGRNRRVNNQTQDDSKNGAAFLAVFRGKVSEGIDFTDDYARAVIIIGIPFPNLHDILVELKRKYNDTYKSFKNLLGGGDWYCQQAYRALNQAAGRCIRHRFDYGAIIFLDERYRQPRNRASISKWLRPSIKLYDNFEESMEGLRYFVNNVKERVDSKILESQDHPVEQNLSSENQSERKENQIQNKSNHPEPRDIREVVDVKPNIAGGSRSMRRPGVNYGNSISRLSYPYDQPVHTFVKVKEEAKCCKEVIDLECCVQPEPRYREVSAVTNCDEDLETCSMINGISAGSSCSKNESSRSETGLRSLRSPDQFLKKHISTANFRKSPLGPKSSVIVTPERYSIGDTRNSTLEAGSVNSHAFKRRKFNNISPVIIDLEEEEEEEENSDAPSTRPAAHTSFTRRIEFGSTEPRFQNYNIFCLLCKNSLGHSENHSYLNCLLTSSSKKYVLSLLKETSRTGAAEMPTSVSVVMTDCSLVNQRLCGSFEGSKGIWCEQDGCVYKTIFCPFCSIPTTCLGVQVMATDSSNVQFQSKILFFADHLEVVDDAASKETESKHKESLDVTNTALEKSDVSKSVERDFQIPQRSSKIQEEAVVLQN